MNQTVFRFAALSLAAASLISCGKKDADVAQERAASPAASAPAEPETTVSRQAAEPSPGAAAPAPASPADPALADVPAELLASDRAYEAWFKKYELDLNDPKMLDADPDGDGATNREEFMADTDPHDPASRPGIHKVMRLKEYSEVRVPFVLQSVEGRTASLKHESDQKTETVAIGQTVGGMKVEKITSRHETDKNGQPVDLSRVELDDPTTKQKIVLVKDMTTKSGATSAVLISADGTTMKVHQGETFTWPTEKGATFHVIDLRADQVVVQEVVSKRMWTIPKE